MTDLFGESARWWLLASLIALLVGCDRGTVSEERLPPRSFPSVELHDLAGVPRTLAPTPGEVLVVNIWATWCAPCRRELPSLDRLAQILDPSRFRVVGVAIDDDPRLVQEYLRDKAIKFAQLMDSGGRRLGEELHIVSYPSTFVVRGDATIAVHAAGERVWHSREVVNELERIAAGGS